VFRGPAFLAALPTSVLPTSLQPSASRLQTSPIIVKLVEPKKDPTGLADVLIGALGLTGAITVVAVALGVVTAAIIFWVRSRVSSR
jgi:hypothetical protein